MAPSPDFVHRFEPGSSTLTLLLLHGTGGDETSLLEMGRSLAPEANLLSPRGKVLEGTQARFFRRLAEGVFDEADLIARTHELADFVALAASEYGFDPARVVAFGFSNGANMGASLLLLRPTTLAGAVLMRPMVPLVPEQPPDLRGVTVFAAGGARDTLALPAQTEALVQILREAGADVTYRLEDAGHKMTPGELRAVRQWIAERWG